MAALPLLSWFWVQSVQDLPPVAASDKHRGGKAWDLVREPMFRRLLLVNWFLSSCWDVHTFVLPVLGHERGLSASVIGSILGRLRRRRGAGARRAAADRRALARVGA